MVLLHQSGGSRPDALQPTDAITGLTHGTRIAITGAEFWKMKTRILILAAAVITLLPLSALAGPRGGRGGFYGGGFYGGGFYNPYWGGGPYWGPGGYGFGANAYVGEVKLDTKVREAQVFVNGAYAGTTHDNKTMHFRPGTYRIEIKANGQTAFNEKVYVMGGKTLRLRPNL